MTNFETFQTTLERHYVVLFETPDYAFSKARYTPAHVASKMTNGLLEGSANKDGEGIKRTCKELGVKYTYREIEKYLAG